MKVKIDFYHIDAMEAPNYEPIHRELLKLGVDSRLVAVPGRANTGAEGWFDYERLKSYYETRGIEYFTDSDHFRPAVTTQNHDFLAPYNSLRLRQLYGPMVFPEAWGLSKRSTEGFDGIFVHGTDDLKYFSKWKDPQDLVNIGYPRYDDYFAGRIDKKFFQDQWGVDSNKKTIVYLPTWQHHSSIDTFLDQVAALQKDFHILIKPHHCTLRREPDRMARIRASGIKLIESSYELPPIIAVADLILADSRSCVFNESIMADKLTIGLVVDKNDYAYWLNPSGASKLAPLCDTPPQIKEMVSQIFDQDLHKEVRREWVERKISYRDGTASQKAAQFIAQFVERKLRGRNFWVNFKSPRRLVTNSFSRLVVSQPWLKSLAHPKRTLRKAVSAISKKR